MMFVALTYAQRTTSLPQVDDIATILMAVGFAGVVSLLLGWLRDRRKIKTEVHVGEASASGSITESALSLIKPLKEENDRLAQQVKGLVSDVSRLKVNESANIEQALAHEQERRLWARQFGEWGELLVRHQEFDILMLEMLKAAGIAHDLEPPPLVPGFHQERRDWLSRVQGSEADRRQGLARRPGDDLLGGLTGD